MKDSILRLTRGVQHLLLALAALTCMVAYHLFAAAGLRPAPLALGLTADEEILKALGTFNAQFKALEGVVADIKLLKETDEERKRGLDDVQRKVLDFSRARLASASVAETILKHGRLSEAAAAHLGGVYMLASLRQDTEGRIRGNVRDYYGSEIKNVLGLDVKTALTSSDIPLPTQYSGQIAELVSQYGAARRYGTVIPLGSGSFKLPKIKTDPAWSLIAGSGTVTEKSPQAENVTFTAEKFGGLVRLPSELEEDSIIDMGQFLARWAARGAAYCEDWQFFRSTGAASGINGTAEGLTKSVVTDSKTVALASGSTANSALTLAKMRAMRPVVDAAALGMSAYYFHPTFEQLFSTFNSSGDKPYLASGINGASLDGFPIRWVDVMPAYSATAAASSVFGLFGDVSYNYLGIRGGFRFDTSREAGFATDEVLVRALERMTVGKMAAGAVCGVITAAS